VKEIKYLILIILLVCYPSLSLYAHNLFESSIQSAYFPLLISAVFGVSVYLLVRLVLKDSAKSFIMASTVILFFFLYGHIYQLYSSRKLAQFLPVSENLVLFSVIGLILILLIILLKKTDKLQTIVSSYIVFIGILLVSVLFFIIPNQLEEIVKRQQLANFIHSTNPKVEINNKTVGSYPDIYYIIFDRYARADILKKYFNFDNLPHISYLKNQGFSVNESAYANYPTTYLSLASSLNMQHLTWLEKLMGESYKNRWIVYAELLNKNFVAVALKNMGYKYYFFGSSWEGTEQSDIADKNFNAFENIDQFSTYIYENTALNAFFGMVANKQSFMGVTNLVKNVENEALKRDSIPQVAAIPGPKFVFAHFLTPHPPNVVDQNCNTVAFETLRKQTEEKNYTNELQCANLIMKELAEKIAKKSKRPYVIIFQSDEGPYLPKRYFDDQSMPNPMTDTSLEIHSKILLAIKTSDGSIKAPKTPVNIFPLVFNNYFGSSIKTKNDRSYIAPNHDRPYDFMDVTSQVKN